MDTTKKICIVLPCYNEALAITSVMQNFQAVLPEAEIHVFDNSSTDNTGKIAREAGAIVHFVSRKGKGHVVQAMFRDVDADVYVLADGDGTYPAEYAPVMIQKLINDKADLVVGTRLSTYARSKSRSNHYWGNRLLTITVNNLFQADIVDLLSGYRVMSRRFVKSIPLFSQGFEVETAMSIHAIEVGAKIVELPIEYLPRAEGSQSKLNTYNDGIRIFYEIFTLYKDHAPKWVYGTVSTLFFLFGLLVGLPVIVEFIETGLVSKIPSAILASGLMLIGFFTSFTGIILSTLAKSRKEIKKLAFLAMG